VQRAAIVLAEKGLPFERRDIDLTAKPDWFLRLSPTGKTPMLLVGGDALFESAAICEYLDETALPRLHPDNALQRARHRAWMEFGSGVLDRIGAFYRANDDDQLQQRAEHIRARFVALEEALGDGPYFDGPFSIVDAVFGPVFRYFGVFEMIGDFGFFDGLPKVSAWRRALSERPSVRQAAHARYGDLLRVFLLDQQGALAERMQVRMSASDVRTRKADRQGRASAAAIAR
jgi:glutathione S-transferase